MAAAFPGLAQALAAAPRAEPAAAAPMPAPAPAPAPVQAPATAVKAPLVALELESLYQRSVQRTSAMLNTSVSVSARLSLPVSSLPCSAPLCPPPPFSVLPCPSLLCASNLPPHPHSLPAHPQTVASLTNTSAQQQSQQPAARKFVIPKLKTAGR